MRTKLLFHTVRAILFYTVGYPGAGKTTFAKTMSGWLGASYLRGDKIGFELFRFPTYSAEERRIVHEEMQRRAAKSLQRGQHVLYDAATNTEAQRKHVVMLAKEYGAHAIGLWIQVPVEVAKRRAGRLRDHEPAGPAARIIPPHIFDQYVVAFEKPQDNELILPIAGDAPFYLQYRRLQRHLHPHGISLPRVIQ